jgi:hypothetical protein
MRSIFTLKAPSSLNHIPHMSSAKISIVVTEAEVLPEPTEKSVRIADRNSARNIAKLFDCGAKV